MTQVKSPGRSLETGPTLAPWWRLPAWEERLRRARAQTDRRATERESRLGAAGSLTAGRVSLASMSMSALPGRPAFSCGGMMPARHEMPGFWNACAARSSITCDAQEEGESM